jgi:hypothetical protein
MRTLVIVCLSAALLPLLPRQTGVTRSINKSGTGAAREWPEPFRSMREDKLSDTERRFAEGVQVGHFQQDGRQWLVRWIRDASRRVHPAEECYRATGWSVRPRPAQLSSGGDVGLLGRQLKWGCCAARRGVASVEVCQTIIDNSGRSWSDVGSWWWSAAFGRSEGPWLGVVRVIAMPDGK